MKKLNKSDGNSSPAKLAPKNATSDDVAPASNVTMQKAAVDAGDTTESVATGGVATDESSSTNRLALLKRLRLPSVRTVANIGVGVAISFAAFQYFGARDENAVEDETAFNQPHGASETSDPLPAPVEPATIDQATKATSLVAGDEFLAARDVISAAAVYKRIAVESGEKGNFPLIYRLAICNEYEGELKEGLARYQQIIDNSPEQNLVIVARLGAARIWYQTDKAENAKRLMWSILMQPGVPEDTSGYVLHSLAQMSLSSAFTYEPNLLKNGIFAPKLETLPDYILNLSKLPPVENQLAADSKVVRRLDQLNESDPNYIAIQVAISMAPLMRNLQAISTEVSLKLDVTNAALAAIQNRNVQMFARDIDLATALDAVLEPLDLVWTTLPRGIRIRHKREVEPGILRKVKREQAARIAQRAITLFPDLPLAPESSLSLGNVSYLSDKFESAAIRFEEITRQYPDAPAARRAWINLAQSRIRMDAPDEAKKALFRVVDEFANTAIEGMAYFLLGQIEVEFDNPSSAAKHLGRAVSIAQDERLKSEASILLASAHLLAGNPHSGNGAIASQREILDGEPFYQQAFFLSSFARYRAAATQKARQRPGYALTTALAKVTPESFSGSTGYFLIGQAFDEIGFGNQMEQTFKNGVANVGKSRLRDRMQFSLAQYFQTVGKMEDAKLHYAALIEKSDVWSRPSTLQLAAIELDENEPNEALRRSRNLLRDSKEVNETKEILRLMGKVYERQSDYYNAALCFSGMVPYSPLDTLAPLDTEKP